MGVKTRDKMNNKKIMCKKRSYYIRIESMQIISLYTSKKECIKFYVYLKEKTYILQVVFIRYYFVGVGFCNFKYLILFLMLFILYFYNYFNLITSTFLQ